MIAHGFLAALTFGLSGYLYQQTGTLEMDQLGGLLRRLPFIGAAPDHGGVRRVRSAGLRQFRRGNHGVLRRLEGLPARHHSGLLGRA